MREIKFRAWDKETRVMRIWMPANDWNIALGNPFKDRVYEVMQFTGIHDKNGKDIYEGDIIRENFENFENEMGSFQPGVGEVVWCNMNSCCGFHLRQQGQTEEEGYSIGTDCEIIGNIYENPELLSV